MFYREKQKSKFTRRFLGVYLSLAFIFISFGFGWYAGKNYNEDISSGDIKGGTVENKDEIPPYLLQDVDFKLFWDVWNFAKSNYLNQPVIDTNLFYGALAGIVESLGDPYSVFLNPAITEQFTSELSGTFEGIGAEIGIKRDSLVIIAPLPDAPAERAGLRAGDHVVLIDDRDTRGMPLDVAVSHIRGEKGTTVKLTVVREGEEDILEIPIIRDNINVKSVRWDKKEDGIAHLKIAYFNETAPVLFEKAALEIIASNPKGIILDLRNNPGGFLEAAVYVASAWVKRDEVVVIQEFQGGRQEPILANGQAQLNGIPTVVLTNGGSASASEIVAGALKDYGLATIVGETSFGKGSVQTYEELSGGSSIKITIAHWLTPNGTLIEKEGIIPDVEVDFTKEDYNYDRDPQLDKAIEILKNE